MMKINFKRFIQVAGIIDQSEADLVTKFGVGFIGFPLRLPVNKEDLTETSAAEIIRSMSSTVKAVLITYLSRADDIVKFTEELGTDIVQLHGEIKIDELKKLKAYNSRLSIIKSLVIKHNNADKLKNDIFLTQQLVDAFITDTYDPSTGASGATGKTHDWQISREFVEISEKPVILAGGLNPRNVYDAILQVKPAGVDVHSGVEDPDGRKDAELVKLFVDEAVRGFDTLGY
ncbi:MAG: phosphoribosylanthranilate isomerase [Melioribacteraceae bacterium]|nr:phosphoribosylanthranilate isomerase [Melioribacteraceae bacterium]